MWGSRVTRPTLWETYPEITSSKEGASDHSAVVIELNVQGFTVQAEVQRFRVEKLSRLVRHINRMPARWPPDAALLEVIVREEHLRRACEGA